MIYTLDTNVVVDALRQAEELDRLKSFLSWALPSTVLSSVVAAELTAGARTDRARRVLDDAVLAPFDRRRRILAPSVAAWRRAGALFARAGATGLTASRQNDALLAAQAREWGWVVVTRDHDFQTLRPLISGLKVAAPYPPRPR
ncbi:MAG TPA: PIN domain-containing protein [Gemmatimonadaceae bacterium]|nr:PIN domain-containing protein [Gemmatimonadaceae bacterium]